MSAVLTTAAAIFKLAYGLWPALSRAGLRRVGMHSLRHSFAPALIIAGAPVTGVQSLLGRSSPAVTLKVYSLVQKRRDRFGGQAGEESDNRLKKSWTLFGHFGRLLPTPIPHK